MLHIHADALGLGEMFVDDAVDQVLDVFQAFAAFADEGFAFFGKNLQPSASRASSVNQIASSPPRDAASRRAISRGK